MTITTEVLVALPVFLESSDTAQVTPVNRKLDAINLAFMCQRDAMPVTLILAIKLEFFACVAESTGPKRVVPFFLFKALFLLLSLLGSIFTPSNLLFLLLNLGFLLI